MRTTPVRPGTLSAPESPTALQLEALIMGAYGEMPGLNLNVKQLARMFACSESTCGVAVGDLVNHGRLRKLATGGYAKA